MFKTIWMVIICGAAIVPLLNTAVAQESEMNRDLSAVKLENVHLKSGTLSQALSRLSVSYDIPIGLEVSLNDEDVPVIADFDKVSVKDLLNHIFDKNRNYTWKVNDGVINVFPVGNDRDRVIDKLLETEIGHFSVEPGSACSEVAASLVNTPELKNFLATYKLSYRQADLSGFYIRSVGRKFRMDVSNMKLGSIMNKIVSESSTAKYWFISRNGIDPQTFTIGCGAKPESSN